MKKIGIAVLAAAGLAVAVPSGAGAATGADFCVLNAETGAMTCHTSDRAATASVAAAELTLGYWYDWINKDERGGYLRLVGGSACTTSTTDTDYGDTSLVDGTWNNRISSVSTANRCDFKFYDGTGYTGAATGWVDSSNNLGTMSNKASSYRIS